MKLKALGDLDVKGKKILLRIDLNSSIYKGKVLESERFKLHAKTINNLKKRGAKVIILAHQGRPGKKDFTSLKQHAKILSKYSKINFVEDIIGMKMYKSVNKLKNGEALLLENVRFLDEEFESRKNNMLVKSLSSNTDIFVQDAFSVCHRDHVSVVALPKVMNSYAGPVLIEEFNALNKISKPKKPIVYVFGGEKVLDYFNLTKKAVKQKALILPCGYFGMLVLISQGYHLGKSEDMLKKAKLLKYLPQIKKLVQSRRVAIPVDFATGINGKRKDIRITNLPYNHLLEDIGFETAEEYVELLKKANTIFMKGTAGFAEDKKFRRGTEMILKAIANNKKAYSLIGGGSLSTLIKLLKINPKKYSYVSPSGGALVKYLSGEKLPGLEVLRK